MARIDIDELLDLDQQSAMSGKDTPDPEKETMAAEQDVDIEKQETDQGEAEKAVEPIEPEHDPNIVEFDGPNDAANPKNWTPRRKMGITASRE